MVFPFEKSINMYPYPPVKVWSQRTINSDYFPLNELFTDVTRATAYTCKPNS